jgi:hypothetical protein
LEPHAAGVCRGLRDASLPLGPYLVEDAYRLCDEVLEHHVRHVDLGLGLLEVPLEPLRLALDDLAAQ